MRDFKLVDYNEHFINWWVLIPAIILSILIILVILMLIDDMFDMSKSKLFALGFTIELATILIAVIISHYALPLKTDMTYEAKAKVVNISDANQKGNRSVTLQVDNTKQKFNIINIRPDVKEGDLVDARVTYSSNYNEYAKNVHFGNDLHLSKDEDEHEVILNISKASDKK